MTSYLAHYIIQFLQFQIIDHNVFNQLPLLIALKLIGIGKCLWASLSNLHWLCTQTHSLYQRKEPRYEAMIFIAKNTVAI